MSTARRGVMLFAAALVACAIPLDVGGEQACTTDAECGTAVWCVAGRCTPCPDAGACQAPLNQQALRRNGCATCDFAPASQCEGPAWCSSPATCVQGQRCAAGCTDLACCSNTCAEPGCPGRVPVGCATACPEGVSCERCIVGKCACTAGGWVCLGFCTDPGFDAGCTW